MRVELQYFDGCPNWTVAHDQLHAALAGAGTEADVVLRKVETPGEAAVIGFRGSPTILIEGRDPFEEPDAPVGLSCRLYPTPDGLAGAPGVEQIVAALQ